MTGMASYANFREFERVGAGANALGSSALQPVPMRRLVTMFLLAVVLAGCGASTLTPTAPSPAPLATVSSPFSPGSLVGPNTVGGVISPK